MKRLAGAFHFDGSPAEARGIERMLAAMQARPGGLADLWLDGRVGLGSLDMGSSPGKGNGLARAAQPDGALVLALDGRIDNRRELGEALKIEASSPDAEVMLAAYKKWGRNCAEHLLGDFALALWDGAAQALWCARDHFGVRPFYYYLDEQKFVWASSARAVLAYDGVPFNINEARIADYLLDLEGIDKQVTFYAGVRRLEPAHALTVRAGGSTSARFWELTPALHDRVWTEDETLEAFQTLLYEAVRCRLAAPGGAASMLSGGIDSGSVTAVGREILARAGGDSLPTFSGISDDPDLNRESAHIRAMLEQGGLQPGLIAEKRISQRLDELTALIENEDEPFDWAMNLPRLVYMEAAEANIPAVMDGLDGDILLGRCDYIARLWRSGQVGAALGETLWAGGVTATLESRWALFFHSLRSACVPQWMRAARRTARRRGAAGLAVKNTLIRHEFAGRIDLRERLNTFDSQKIDAVATSSMEAHKNELVHANLTVGLERYERVAGALSVEARHPLLDVRLASFCLGLPWQYKTRRGWTKVILRRAAAPLLPAQVVWRKDKDQLMWIFNQIVLKERRDDFYQACRDEQRALAAFIDMPKLFKCWQDYDRHGDEKNARYIWTGVALALWLRRQRTIATGGK